VLGFILGVVIGVVRWLFLDRSAKAAVLSLLATMMGGMFLCAIAGVGPAQFRNEAEIVLRSSIVGGAILSAEKRSGASRQSRDPEAGMPPSNSVTVGLAVVVAFLLVELAGSSVSYGD